MITAKFPDATLYIDGRATQPLSDERLPNIYPATGEHICDIGVAGVEDIDRAIQAASRGFAVWSKTHPVDRGRVLRKAADIIRQNARSLAEAEVFDTGKPIREAEPDDVVTAIDCFDYMGGQAASMHGHHFDFGESFAYTRREPLGVCVGIGAWNYPIQLAAWKAGPCLAAGNAMIFKPSELTPTNAVRLASILSEAGLPDGVFNVLQGGADVAQALIAHPGVAKISLTGSAATGRRVMAAASAGLKRITLELGGKSPLIVFEDADLDRAASACLAANFYSQGENCCNGTRVFVHASIYEEFVSQLAKRADILRVGDPMDSNTQIGSLISRAHQSRVLAAVQDGLAGGARLVCGGRAALVAGFEGGSFVEPTIFADCRDEMSIVREEIFGPVMSVLRFDDEEEVIRRANDTPYGLAAGVFTRDITRAHRVIANLQAGVCWINTYNVAPATLPFGGYKQSGIGRENGIYAIDDYTQIKSVYVELGAAKFAYDD